MKYILLVSAPFYALDRVTKHLVLSYIDPNGSPPVIIPNFFRLVNITNTGAAFGSFRNNNNFFIVISFIAALLALILLVARHRAPESDSGRSAWWTRTFLRDASLALLLAGVLGNLTDRLVYGHVIDFLLFDFGPHLPSIFHPYPAFNVADSCIFIAVVFFIIHSFRVEKKTPETI